MSGRARGAKQRNNQLAALAVDLAEKQLREGTASSQIVTHYLKLADPKRDLEIEALKEEVKLLKAKTADIEMHRKTEQRYLDAMKAFSGYKVDLDENI